MNKSDALVHVLFGEPTLNTGLERCAESCAKVSALYAAEQREPYEMVRALQPIRDEALALAERIKNRTLMDFARQLDLLIDEYSEINWEDE